MKEKYQEIARYLICGVSTTIVDFVVFYLLHRCLAMNTLIATALAWLAAVIFAYITNHAFVFKSDNKVLQEFISFIGVRVASGMMQVCLMVILCDVLKLNDIYAKIIVGAIVTITNYIASKVFVFKQVEGPYGTGVKA